MRINPDPNPRYLAAIDNNEQQLQTALNQVASGRRVNVPSDDPVAASLFLSNLAQTAQNDQYTSNSQTVSAMLQNADSVLGNVVISLNQAITLGVQGSDGTLSDSNRQQIAASIDSILQQVVQLANSTFRGSYIFGGTNSGVAPYVADGSSPSGYRYQGNSSSNVVQIGQSLSIQVNLPGNQLFSNPAADALGSLAALSAALRSGNGAVISSATTQVRTALDNVSQQRVFYGNTINQIGENETALQQEKVQLKTDQNNLVGIDLPTAALNLNQAQTTRSAILAAIAKVAPESLLDYLK